MNTKEIVEGNKLIADFMEVKSYNGRGWWGIDKMIYEFNEQVNPFEGKTFLEDDLKYYSLWEWLMPVVEKIESIHDDHHGYFGVHIHSNCCDIQGTNLHMALRADGYGSVYMSDPNAILSTKKESTWYNVVNFIKWYNNEKIIYQRNDTKM